MSRRSIEELKFELINLRERKIKEKRIFFSLEEHKYKKFLTAIVLSNKKGEEIEKTYKEVINSLIDSFIENTDFYDLSEDEIDEIAELFDEIV